MQHITDRKHKQSTKRVNGREGLPVAVGCAWWQGRGGAPVAPMCSPVGRHLGRSVVCHSEPNPCSVNDESHRLRVPRCSIVCFTKECAVGMVEWHINVLSDAPPPTGTHLSRAKVCRVRRDLNPDHPPCFSRTEHLLRELRRSRGDLSCKSRP